MTMSRALLLPVFVFVVMATGLRPAAAQGLGVRAGVSGDPTQFYVGGHAEIGPVVDTLWFRPNLEIGFGDDQTIAAINFEFAYSIEVRGKPFQVYVGAGPALNIIRHRGDSDAEGGFNILFGVAHRRGLFAEVKAGFAHSPGFKFGVGYTWRQ
jgi:hypothetical protein